MRRLALPCALGLALLASSIARATPLAGVPAANGGLEALVSPSPDGEHPGTDTPDDGSGVSTRLPSGPVLPVPEPVTALLFGAGLAGLGILGRTRS